MGKKLLAIFEESWEISQSINDLKELKEQNEENLKAKVAELESAVGDITLYNRLSEEITALKEVMKNNDNILVEKTANLEKSNQEKKTVQNEIVGIISQFSQSQGSQNDNEENSKHIEKSLKLLEMESDILDHNFLSSKESTHYGTSATSSESRILNLELELRKMKRQLEEKDKQLAQNEQLIKTLYQFKEKPKAIKASLLVSPRQGSKNSPMKSRVITNDFLQPESYKLEQSQEASVPATKKSHNKMKITSPITIKINQPLYNLRSAEKQISASSNLNSNLNSANTSTIITKLPPESKPVTRNGRGESQLQREDSIKKQTTLVLEKPQQPSNRGSHKKKPKKNGHDKHRQSFETISIEDLKNYSDKLNKINFDNVEKKSEEKFSYLQHYQNRKKKQEDLTLLRQQSTIYKISDSTHYSTGKPQHQSHINLNNIKSPIKIENEIIASNEPQVVLTIENAQDHQQQLVQVQQNAESSSPELSSIGQSYEQSGDLSMKEILLENFSLDQKDKTTLKKDQEKSQRDDKENVQDLESKDTELIKNDILPQGAYTRQHSSTLPVSKHISHKRNEGLQMIECRNLETSDLKNISSGSKPSEKNIIPGEKIFDLNLQSHQAKVKAVVSNFFTYSKQYYNEDSENKYSKRYEIIKGKKAAKGAIHERSQQFLDTGNNLIYEVNSLVSLRSPKKVLIIM